jgi:anti-sigma regulatory factor (Ser/Thr protein kinase)
MVTEPTARSAQMPDVAAVDGALSHLALFYRDQRDYLARIEEFASAGHAAGEPVFIAVPGDKGSLLRDNLGGPVRYADMADLGRNPARIIPEVREFIDAHPGQRVRYVVEPVWPGRSAAEMCEVARHEALIDLAFAGMAATILCSYDAAGLPPSVVRRAERSHGAERNHGAERSHPAVPGNGHLAAGRSPRPGALPPECDRPLPDPPGAAETLSYDTNLRPLRSLVAGYAHRAGLPDGRAANLVLAASEIAANTLRHTSAGGTMHIWHTGEEILCQIKDQGWITDPLAGRIRQPPDERGHGLWVVNQVCDLVELRTGPAGTTVRMHMSIREP